MLVGPSESAMPLPARVISMIERRGLPVIELPSGAAAQMYFHPVGEGPGGTGAVVHVKMDPTPRREHSSPGATPRMPLPGLVGSDPVWLRACRHVEAASRSELLLDQTQARMEDIQREIDGLKLKRKDVETTIEASIQTLRNTLEFVREQEARDRDDRILLHRPRPAEFAENPEAHPARKIAR